jgi:Leucine-rich repeat (LRR) protein
MVHLSGLKNLQVLNLNATQITDAGLPHIARLTNLQQLDLGNCLKVSMDGIQTLQAELPACTITR